MPNWEKMYALMCAAASEALDVLPETAVNASGRAILKQALETAEEMYIAAEGEPKE